MQKLLLILCLGLLLTGCGGTVAAPVVAPQQAIDLDQEIKKVEKLQKDPAASKAALENDALTLAWEWFIWLNLPLDNSSPKMWESWKPTSAVYLPNGMQPPPWNENPTPDAVLQKAKQQGLDTNLPFHNLDSFVQVDGNTLSDKNGQDVRYQLLMNQATFDYIVQKGIYNVNGQEQLAQNNTPADFPQQAWELKTSWIWIGNDDQGLYNELKDHYYIVNAYYQDPSNPDQYEVGQAALTGMHMINKLVPQWVWITFENVANASHTQVQRKLPMDQAISDTNSRFQDALRARNSILANYQLDGVQFEFLNTQKQPILLANSQIESAFQESSSCITCHSTASYSLDNGYFNITKKQADGFTYYTGNPPDLKGYTSLDFVWSLKRAARKP